MTIQSWRAFVRHLIAYMARRSSASCCSAPARAGDARPDSDYDVAVFLKELPDRWRELDRLAQLSVEFIDDTGAFFDAKPYKATAYGDRTPLVHEIRRGLTL